MYTGLYDILLIVSSWFQLPISALEFEMNFEKKEKMKMITLTAITDKQKLTISKGLCDYKYIMDHYSILIMISKMYIMISI